MVNEVVIQNKLNPVVVWFSISGLQRACWRMSYTHEYQNILGARGKTEIFCSSKSVFIPDLFCSQAATQLIGSRLHCSTVPADRQVPDLACPFNLRFYTETNADYYELFILLVNPKKNMLPISVDVEVDRRGGGLMYQQFGDLFLKQQEFYRSFFKCVVWKKKALHLI